MKQRYTTLVALFLVVGCGDEGDLVVSAELGVAEEDASVVAGFRLDASRSYFGTVHAAKSVETVVRGDKRFTFSESGVFSVNERNGAVRSIPSAWAEVLTKPPFGRSGEQHNELARQYFLSAGMPEGQIGGLRSHSLVGGDGHFSDPASDGKPTLIGRYTSVLRVVDGFPVDDSVAWVRFSEDGEVVAETVYWPNLPTDTVDSARRIEGTLENASSRESYLSKLPSDLRTRAGRVCIRHSSMDDDGGFDTRAVYQVLDRSEGRGRIKMFDEHGDEVLLARQKRTAPVGSRSRTAQP